MAQLRAGRLPRRLSQLAVGLVLYGTTLAMLIRSTLGNAPWDVLHQGLARHLPITIGQAVIATSMVVLLLWMFVSFPLCLLGTVVGRNWNGK